jgi:hypothetical protein
MCHLKRCESCELWIGNDMESLIRTHFKVFTGIREGIPRKIKRKLRKANFSAGIQCGDNLNTSPTTWHCANLFQVFISRLKVVNHTSRLTKSKQSSWKHSSQLSLPPDHLWTGGTCLSCKVGATVKVGNAVKERTRNLKCKNGSVKCYDPSLWLNTWWIQ